MHPEIFPSYFGKIKKCVRHWAHSYNFPSCFVTAYALLYIKNMFQLSNDQWSIIVEDRRGAHGNLNNMMRCRMCNAKVDVTPYVDDPKHSVKCTECKEHTVSIPNSREMCFSFRISFSRLQIDICRLLRMPQMGNLSCDAFVIIS